ncbi:MAG: hypothetical protein ACRDJH_27270 [Thermomicrobiales bacterium]
MPGRDKRATEGQRFPLRISVVLPGSAKGPENIMLSTAQYNALEKAAIMDDRPMSSLLRLLAIKDVEAQGLFDREAADGNLYQAVRKAIKLDDRSMSGYFRSLVTRYVTELGLYDPKTALHDNEIAQDGKAAKKR